MSGKDNVLKIGYSSAYLQRCILEITTDCVETGDGRESLLTSEGATPAELGFGRRTQPN